MILAEISGKEWKEPDWLPKRYLTWNRRIEWNLAKHDVGNVERLDMFLINRPSRDTRYQGHVTHEDAEYFHRIGVSSWWDLLRYHKTDLLTRVRLCYTSCPKLARLMASCIRHGAHDAHSILCMNFIFHHSYAYSFPQFLRCFGFEARLTICRIVHSQQ